MLRKHLIFGSGESAEVIIGSADLMTRNLYHRFEVCVRIKNETYKEEFIKYFTLQWHDNDKAVMLLPDFGQKKIYNNGATRINAQQSIYHFLETRQ